MKVAAVFCTMNRVDTASECLKRLAAQLVRPQMVVVTDNASTDGTRKELEALDDLGFQFELIRSEENLGNAGGVALAMERAFELGADAVWILDDDSWPQPDALGKLVEPGGPKGLRSSLVIVEKSGEPSWPFQIRQDGKWVTTTVVPLGQDWIRVRRSWLGILIPRNVRDRIGPINSELFLRGEDEDYPRRIEKAGFEVFMCSGSHLCHPPGGDIGQIGLLGHQVVLEKGLEGKKLYYRLRNSWWLKRRDEGPMRAGLLAACHCLLLLREGTILGNLSYLRHAAWDAWSDRLGRRDRFD